MALKTPCHYIATSNNFIFSLHTKQRYRLSEKDFIRNRKLPFEYLVLCMLKMLRRSLQIELNSFLKELRSSVKSISSSAFIQSRKKLNPDLFYDLNNLIVKEYYSDNDERVSLYKEHRVLSVDGSTIQLPLTNELKDIYGTFNNQKITNDVVIARVSVLYDVLNEIVLDGKLCNFQQGEVPLCHEHLQYAQKGDLIIMDRAYPSFESSYLMKEKGIEFLYRCKITFSNQVKAFYESRKKESLVEIKAKQHKSFKNLAYKPDSSITVRLIRITLPSGETEILMTSLLDTEKYEYNEFKNLYFKRWKVETFYNRFKNIIGVENFSGISNQFIQQEFNCALYLSNMQTILTEDVQTQVEEKYKNRKYEYKINKSLSLGFIRERLLQLYSRKDTAENILMELQELFVKNVVPVRNGRNNKRNVDKYRQRTKPKQFMNRRIVF